MKKLKLVFSPYKSNGNDESSEEKRTMTDEEINIFKKSKRKYENIEFDAISFGDEKFYLEFLAERAGSWKYVEIYDRHPEPNTWSEFFKIIEPSVEELGILTSSESQLTEYGSKLTFPRLKSLNCQARSLLSIYKFFVGCTSLTKFHWDLEERSDSTQSNFTPDVLTIMRNNQKLKDIHADNNVMSTEHSFKFQLQKLVVTDASVSDPPPNLCSFLKTHAQTLESLDTRDRCFNLSCLELILTGMPSLTSLTMETFYTDETVLKERPLPMNTTITTLELTYARFGSRTAFENLIKALSALKHFKTDYIDNKLMFALSRSAPDLETFETEHFYASRLPEGDIFPNIKKFKADYFDGVMREPTGEHKFAAMVAKEMKMHPEIEFESEFEAASSSSSYSESSSSSSSGPSDFFDFGKSPAGSFWYF